MLPKWLLLTIHITILTVTGLAALTMIPGVFTKLGLPAEAHYGGLVVTYAGLACAYVLKSPFVLGWLSIHDPADVAIASQALAAKRAAAAVKDAKVTPPPMPPMALFVLVLGTVFLAACLPGTVVVPVTPANQAQVDSCKSIASTYNAFVFAGLAMSAGETGAGVAGAAISSSNPNAKTGFAVGDAVGAALLAATVAYAAYASSDFSNSHCSDVVGALPPMPLKKAPTPDIVTVTVSDAGVE